MVSLSAEAVFPTAALPSAHLLPPGRWERRRAQPDPAADGCTEFGPRCLWPLCGGFTAASQTLEGQKPFLWKTLVYGHKRPLATRGF